jgi:type IV pilus assembly protein PilC
MSNFSYVAVDPQGMESRGTLDVSDQSEALRRIKEMGLFPTKVLATDNPASVRPRHGQIQGSRAGIGTWQFRSWVGA